MDVVVFELQGNRYAISTAPVVEMVRAVAIAPVAGAPRAVEGVFNLRGTIVPVVNVRSRFGLPHADLHPSQHFLIVRVGVQPVALRVDQVLELAAIDMEQVAPASQAVPNAPHVAGVATLDDGLVVIYDVDAFLTQSEADALAPVLQG